MSQPSYTLLAPVIAMVLWTFLIGLSLLVSRLPVVIRYNTQIPPGVTKEQVLKLVGQQKQWRADNFTHLHEAPTIFYVVTLSLTFLNVSDSLTTSLAWLYVALRAVHSLIQVTTNVIVYRFTVFVASQFALLGLAMRAALFIYQRGAFEAYY